MKMHLDKHDKEASTCIKYDSISNEQISGQYMYISQGSMYFNNIIIKEKFLLGIQF